MEYLHWKEEKIADFSDANVSRLYNEGFVFTRIDKGVMHQTRSVRIDLSKFELSSENRRMLKKIEKIALAPVQLPLAKTEMNAAGVPRYIDIGSAAKYFYDTKFEKGIFSVKKLYDILASADTNFNLLLNYSDIGYAICYGTTAILHYSYPFYHIDQSPKDMGLGMMTKAIAWAKEKGLKYVYLGSLQRPGDVYKLQFTGMEWFDGKEWNKDVEEVKKILK